MPTSRLFRSIALAICAGKADVNGRPLLATQATFDNNGPRSIPLGPRAVGRLGQTVLGIGVAMLAIAVLFFSGQFWLGLPAVGAFVLAPVAWRREVVTKWLDRLAAAD